MAMFWIGHVIRMVLLRSASAGMAALWIEPAGKLLLAALVGVGALLGWSAWQRDIGREQAREQAAAISAQAEARALRAAADTSRKLAEITARDDADLAAAALKEEKARNESIGMAQKRAGGGTVWRSDDPWLRAKR